MELLSALIYHEKVLLSDPYDDNSKIGLVRCAGCGLVELAGRFPTFSGTVEVGGSLYWYDKDEFFCPFCEGHKIYSLIFYDPRQFVGSIYLSVAEIKKIFFNFPEDWAEIYQVLNQGKLFK